MQPTVKCVNCDVEVSCSTSNCPLCGKHLEENTTEIQSPYPSMDNLPGRHYSKLFRLFLFLTISSSIIIFTVNILTLDNYLWSIIPICALWLLLPIIGVPINKGRITPLMIVMDNVLICIFLVILDITVGSGDWAMSYVVPFVLSGSALIVTIIVLLRKMTWKELYLFQLSIVFVCFIPIIARIFFTFMFWPSIVSAVYGILTIFAMFIFSDKDMKFESKKRFHF